MQCCCCFESLPACRFHQPLNPNVMCADIQPGRAWPSDPPTQYLDAAAGGEDGGLLPPQLNPTGQQQPSDKWCAPYAYKLRPELGCGGADKWSVEPQEPFPRRSDWFSGNIYCNGECVGCRRLGEVLFDNIASRRRSGGSSPDRWKHQMHAHLPACARLSQAGAIAPTRPALWTASQGTTARLAAAR